MRNALDCVGGKAGWVRASMPLPDIMFWYGTGSPSVQWTESERTLFPASIMVEIDQGAAGSPVMTATVRDVESQAWSPGQAVIRNGWNVERPTIYCARNSIPLVLADGWKGDVWLAWPGHTTEPLPDMPGCTIVAVQDVFTANYDHSTVIDPTWPRLFKAPTTAYNLSVTEIGRTVDMAFSEVPNTDHYVVQYRATTATNPIVLLRALAIASNPERHLDDVTIPPGIGGTIIVHAIIDGKAVMVGERTL
jgi:hypothetical protein